MAQIADQYLTYTRHVFMRVYADSIYAIVYVCFFFNALKLKDFDRMLILFKFKCERRYGCFLSIGWRTRWASCLNAVFSVR